MYKDHQLLHQPGCPVRRNVTPFLILGAPLWSELSSSPVRVLDAIGNELPGRQYLLTSSAGSIHHLQGPSSDAFISGLLMIFYRRRRAHRTSNASSRAQDFHALTASHTHAVVRILQDSICTEAVFCPIAVDKRAFRGTLPELQRTH